MTAQLSETLQDLYCGDDARAEAAALTLAAFPPQQALEALKASLAEPNPDRRWWAVRALDMIFHPQVPVLLVQALADADAAVRQCAALGLRDHPDPQAVPDLVRALADADHLVSGLAGGALVVIGAPAVPALAEVLQNGVPASRLAAVRALAAIGEPDSISALFAVLDEGSALMEYWATQGLERMGVGMAFFDPG